MASTLAATSAWKRRRPLEAGTTSASRKARTAASSSVAFGRSCMSAALLHQLEQLPLHLRRAAAQARQLDVRHPAQERLRLHDADHAPLQVAVDLPPAHGRPVDPRAARLLVGAQEALAVAEPAGRLVVVAEPPGPHAEPAEVLEGIAGV